MTKYLQFTNQKAVGHIISKYDDMTLEECRDECDKLTETIERAAQGSYI